MGTSQNFQVCPRPYNEPLPLQPSAGTCQHEEVGLVQSLMRSLLLSPTPWNPQDFFVCLLKVESVSSYPVALLQSNPAGLQSQIPCESLPSPLLLDPQQASLMWDSEPLQHWEKFSGIIVLLSVGHPPQEYGIWFYCDCTPSYHLIVVSPLYLGVAHLWQHPPVDGGSTANCSFWSVTGDVHMSFYSAILNQFTSVNIYSSLPYHRNLQKFSPLI